MYQTQQQQKIVQIKELLRQLLILADKQINTYTDEDYKIIDKALKEYMAISELLGNSISNTRNRNYFPIYLEVEDIYKARKTNGSTGRNGSTRQNGSTRRNVSNLRNGNGSTRRTVHGSTRRGRKDPQWGWFGRESNK